MAPGVFIFHADSSLVMATHPTIASEFDALDSSSWLFTAFALAGAATQNTVCISKFDTSTKEIIYAQALESFTEVLR